MSDDLVNNLINQVDDFDDSGPADDDATIDEVGGEEDELSEEADADGSDSDMGGGVETENE